MYDDYYRFKQKPFSIAPDPGFLYLSERHREALAHLMYGLRTDGGFVLITGEVGTGKTTLIRSLIDEVPEDLDVAFVLNPRLTVNELLETLCEELGIAERTETAATNKHLIDRLNKHLLRTHALGRSTVVIIDEAQNLSPAVLEQIRLLTNLETNERKLVRIILLGQPELAEMLDRREMRQLVQRVTARYHLAALTREDTRAYIAHRLSLAGGNPHLFTRGAAGETFRLSRGIPRLINVIADRALLGAYVEGRPRVTARIVRKAAREAFGQQAWLRPQLWIGAAIGMVMLVIGGAWALWDHNPPWRAAALVRSDSAQTTTGAPDAQPTQPVGASHPDIAEAQASLPQEHAASVAAPALADAAPTPADPANNATTGTIAPAVIEAPPPVTPTPDPLARPVGVSAFESQRDAYAAVFARWDADFQPSQVPCTQAAQVGLQCLKRSGTWRDIERLNQPVVIELWDDHAEPYYAAVLSHRDDYINIKLGGEEIRATADDLANHWYGSYIVVWQMPPDYRGTLKIGDEGPSVAWLRQHLAAALHADLRATDPARFDDGLRSALIRFQRENGMVPDGVAGPMTWIAMNAASSDVVPTLSPDS
jgi:general secretion pathway protein A